jgi:pyridoxal/pyridoxine/pyridoxamine kinase
MAAELENDRQKNVRKLTQALDMSAKMVYAALMRTAKLSKKSARWVKKRFSLKMKKEQFRTHEAAKAMAAAIL